MKKLITLLLVLTGMVTTASAKTIYLETNSSYWGSAAAKYTVGYWGSEGGFALFSLVENETTLYSAVIPDGATGMKIQRYSPSISDDLALSWEGESNVDYWNTTGNIDSPANNDLITITGWGENNNKQCPWDKTTYSPTPSIATISTVTFSYGQSGEDWTNLALEDGDNDGTYTATLDLSTTSDDQKFKLVINGSWLGTNEFALATGSLGTPGANNTDDLTLDNKSYKTYTISATWVPNSHATQNWTLSITGGTARGSNTYTVTFNNENNWSNVYAYTFGPELCGGWPGTAMTANGDGTYSLSFTDYEPYVNSSATSKILFNDNSGKQTKDLTLIDNHTYSMNPRYFVVGNKDFLGNWGSSVAEMTFVENGDEDYYTFTADAVELNSNVTFKIRQQLYEEQTNFDLYPADDRTISIPVAGKYNIDVRFNSYWQNWSDDNIASGTATKTHEAIFITDAGWATTVTNSALNFEGAAIDAYTATCDGTTVTLTKVNDVQAETGLVLKGAGSNNPYYIPVIASSETPKGSMGISSTAAFEIKSDHVADYYGLVPNGANQAKFALIEKPTGDGVVTIPAKKGFLIVNNSNPNPARELSVVFDNESTGINTVEAVKNSNNVFYNLAGQRVVAPAKGLYIVNGKKVMMK